MTPLRILALEPYYGGSHRTFLDGWRRRSRHRWTVLTLPAHKWKWRMRHAAVTFADQLRGESPGAWDVLVCSDMLNLAEFKGLCPPAAALPAVAYFHENQLTYPVRHDEPRDLHFALTNMTTALAATEVWFNSAFHRDSFLAALDEWLHRMPDHQPTGAVESIRARSSIHPPGIDEFPPRPPRAPGPLRVLWAARWEHDKRPDVLFDAIRILRQQTDAFRLSVVGQQFRDVPDVFEQARQEFRDHVDHWGYLPDRDAYEQVLRSVDVVVSTADHEFFGIAVVEAVAAGAYPLLPNRLAYPEILQLATNATSQEFLYDDGPEELAERLVSLARTLAEGEDIWRGDAERARRLVERFSWNRVAGEMDDALRSAP